MKKKTSQPRGKKATPGETTSKKSKALTVRTGAKAGGWAGAGAEACFRSTTDSSLVTTFK